jgi:hypothetical protein
VTDYGLPWDDLPTPKRRTPRPAEAPEPAPKPKVHPDRRMKRAKRKPRAVRIAPDGGVEWQWWHLVVHGPAAAVADFATAARGAGAIPWLYDRSRVEEDVFALAIGGERRSLSIIGCHLLARQFRDAVEARQARATGSTDRNTGCPLDLHALLPVPPSILRLGSTHPAAEAWLRQHWGVGDQPRRAAVLDGRTAGKRLPHGHVPLVYGFFTEAPAPEAAVAALCRRWTGLVFRLDRRSMT